MTSVSERLLCSWGCAGPWVGAGGTQQSCLRGFRAPVVSYTGNEATVTARFHLRVSSQARGKQRKSLGCSQQSRRPPFPSGSPGHHFQTFRHDREGRACCLISRCSSRSPAKSHPVSLCTPELEGLRETGDGDGGHTGSLVRAGVAVRAGRHHTSSGEVSEVFTVPPSRCHVTRCHRQTWSLGTRSASPSSLG